MIPDLFECVSASLKDRPAGGIQVPALEGQRIRDHGRAHRELRGLVTDGRRAAQPPRVTREASPVLEGRLARQQELLISLRRNAFSPQSAEHRG